MTLKHQDLFNASSPSGFLLLEFSTVRELQILHFIGFLVFYLATVTGNLLIVCAVASDQHLYTPMYFFVMNLAIQDVGQVSVVFPKAMANSLMNRRHISYSGCVAQVLLLVFFAACDFSLITVMAYDRYVAICSPLQYEKLMNKQACIQMVTAVWITGFVYGVLHTTGTFAAPLCSNVIDQFFCEIPALLRLACSDLYLLEIGFIILSTFIGFGCFIFIVVTYVHIFSAVMKIPSVQGKKKAFSTCLPHLIVFSIFIITGYFAYIKPPSNSASGLEFAFTMVYMMVPPLMNPIIYSLRNKEIKLALSKRLSFKLK
ncbi:olfactory receptor 14A16-like [Varanus komodoensis]|uniref:olfactory receptor 14A16-like n=1 Tax=Varanus komodoensis TaxID=61221 RepID=UPI001CF7B6AA|nr:olfactory receptor 14A16-like [Varanus komodoensis]